MTGPRAVPGPTATVHPRPPSIHGVTASRFQVPAGDWPTVLEALCAAFPRVDRATWESRFVRGRVLDAGGARLTADTPCRVGLLLHYYREVPDEPRIHAREAVLHVDDHLIAVDKPHGLPVVPGGGYVEETLLARLVRRFGDIGLAPLHRLDRLTAGVVLFSANPATRAAYQALFRTQRIGKRYEALAPPLPAMAFPFEHRSRLARGEPFFRMREVDGPPNAFTGINVISRGPDAWRYALTPLTGRKHQLRVHMAALGAPILGDPWYPDLADADAMRASEPTLQLLARALAFDDPLDGRPRCFDSGLTLTLPP